MRRRGEVPIGTSEDRFFRGGRRASPDGEDPDCSSSGAEALAALSCGEVTARLFDYMVEAVDPALRARIEHHLTHGPCECRRALLMELAFDERIRRCVCGHQAPASLRQRIRALLT